MDTVEVNTNLIDRYFLLLMNLSRDNNFERLNGIVIENWIS